MASAFTSLALAAPTTCILCLQVLIPWRQRSARAASSATDQACDRAWTAAAQALLDLTRCCEGLLAQEAELRSQVTLCVLGATEHACCQGVPCHGQDTPVPQA